jgi:hypothetical protein
MRRQGWRVLRVRVFYASGSFRDRVCRIMAKKSPAEAGRVSLIDAYLVTVS